MTALPERTASVDEDLAAVPPPRKAVGSWAVDLAAPAPHLVAAVGRALASIPQGRAPETGTEGPGAVVRDWQPQQAVVLAEAAERLDQVW